MITLIHIVVLQMFIAIMSKVKSPMVEVRDQRREVRTTMVLVSDL